jgi:predicted nuclease with TOPRIM domain
MDYETEESLDGLRRHNKNEMREVHKEMAELLDRITTLEQTVINLQGEINEIKGEKA